MKKLLPIILLLNVLQGFGQVNWLENRQPFPAEDSVSDYAMSYLYYGVHFDYKYDESGQFVCDKTYHAITRANNDDGLESTNRIYIPLRNVIEVLDVKSRTISKDGHVVEFDRNNLKEIEDEENDGGYRIFAVEGAEVNGEIEYMYTKRIYGSTFISEPIQFAFPAKKIEFTLTAPENLEFEFLLANDKRTVAQTDTIDTFNRYQVVLENVPAYSAEAFSGFDANKMRIDFRLAYNSAYGKKRINTYADAAKKIFDNAHELNKDEVKIIDKFIKENDRNNQSPISRLMHIEHALKKRFYMDENASDNIVSMSETGFGGRTAFLKFFVAIVEHLGIEYEIVVTADRLESKFDPEFTTWNYLDDYLLYLPGSQKYLAVHDYTERLGGIPPRNSATLGLFIKPELITDYIYPLSYLDSIPEVSYEKNMNNIYMDVFFDSDLSKVVVEAKRYFLGKESNFYKTAEYWMDQEQLGELLDDLAKYLATDGDILSVNIDEKNNTPDTWEKPYVVNCKFENKNFIEYAGNSILFKAGKLIGLQSELYKDEERKFDVENTNNRGYVREINIEIPKGYEIQNPDDIVLNEKVFDANNEPIYVFESSYTITEKQLKISINEFYDEIFFPKERFEEFRKVINAAADWNKVTLVLKEI